MSKSHEVALNKVQELESALEKLKHDPAAVTREEILTEIKDWLDQGETEGGILGGNNPGGLIRRHDELISARALIELLECHDVGSVGGFDLRGQEIPRIQGISDLRNRYEYLKSIPAKEEA